jgi:hypothetical protein
LATSGTIDRQGSKTSRIRATLSPADGGRGSFILAIRDAVIVSISGPPLLGPFRQDDRAAATSPVNRIAGPRTWRHRKADSLAVQINAGVRTVLN